jgi:hypothetical protein
LSKAEIGDFGRLFGFFFSCIRGTKKKFPFTRENSPVQPLKLESPTKLESPKIGQWGGSNPAVAKGKISRYFGFDDAGFLQRTTKLDNKFGPFMGP